MQPHIRDRILRKLDGMSDERAYQVLDFVEFMESRYADKQAPTGNPFTRFTDAVEDRLRAGRMSASTVAEAVGLMNKAASVLNGAVQATMNVANELVNTPPGAPASPGQTSPQTPPSAPPPSAPPPSGGPAPASRPPTPGEASSPAHDTPAPGDGEEKL